jgi:hypothetical protein
MIKLKNSQRHNAREYLSSPELKTENYKVQKT